ncbi:hypothetical protein A4R40_12645 [Photorhabdus laumondii subsp. laumondii]|nr:hypothetical protein A4R40_12645 [Photorhabdus laumondii subsp. laumondii]
MVYVSVAEELLFNAAAHDYATMLVKYLSGAEEVSGWLGAKGVLSATCRLWNQEYGSYIFFP